MLPAGTAIFQVSPVHAQSSNRGSHRSIQLEKNDVINIAVSGVWSATCALEKSRLFENIHQASFGPEGFKLQLASGDSSADGKDERDSTVKFTTESTTNSVGLSLPSFSVYGVSSPFSASTSSQKTTGTTTSSEKSKYRQTSKFSSSIAAFQSGVRLKDTPYPQFPAGAYIAVVVSRDHGEGDFAEVIDAFVLGAHSSYVSPKRSEVYFVVNDCNDNKPKADRLNVQLQHLKPASVEAAKLIDKMVYELRTFSFSGERIVQEGGDLSSRIQGLRSAALANLQKDTLIDLRADPTLQSMFHHWLDNEANKIVRKARIIELRRNIYLTHLDVEGIERQIGSSRAHTNHVASRLNQVVTHVRHFPLYERVLETIKTATKYILPVLHLYYPHALAGITGIRLDGEESPMESMATQVKRLSEKMLDILAVDSISEKTGEYIIVRIPRPGSELDATRKEQLPLISDERATILWDHLFRRVRDGKSWGLRLEFKDLYRDTAASGLFPRQGAPIIMDMALLLGVDTRLGAEHLHSQLLTTTLDMLVDREQLFPFEQGPKRLLLAEEKLQSHKISLGFVSSEEPLRSAVDRIRSDISINLNTAKGLSPFTAFSFGMYQRKPLEHIRDSLEVADDGYPKHLTDVFVIMKLVSTKLDKPMSWF
ncbi:MAG: hypothetical protein JKY15_08925 [Deltaproteobacteria bacterium]|nr:hypothetical protein [Deltaproteobacteria bacterium]